METRQMKEQVEVEPGRWEYRDVPVPVPADNEVLLKMRVCAIGAGEPRPGHGFFGTVEEMGPEVKGFLIGDRVAASLDSNVCFAQFVSVPADQCYGLSEEMDDYTAAFVAPLAQIVRAVDVADAPMAQPCVIHGADMLRTALANARGLAPVICIVEGESQRAAAVKMGADYVIDSTAEKDVDAALEQILKGRKAVHLSVDEKELNAPDPREGWEEAITLLQYHRIDPKPIFSIAVPLKELPEVLAELGGDAGPANVFIDTSLQTRFVFPGYREPVNATIAP